VVDTQERWHARTAEDALALLGTAAGGLTQAEADARLRDHGANVLPSPKRRSPVVRFLLQFHNILIYVLIGAAVITAFLDHLTDTFVILAVVIANAVIGFIQEEKRKARWTPFA